MEYRPLGKTGMRVSALSFGASSLGGVFREVDEQTGIRAVRTALDLGINFIDVSPFYGLTKAETVLGRALVGVQRERYFLATKCGRYGASAEDFDFSAARVTKSVDESLARLGVDYLDIIQVHDMEFGDVRQIVGETVPALLKVKERGKARFVGITGLPLVMFVRVVEQFAAGTIDTILSYCHYELNDTSLLEILPAMEQRGIGVINASPLGMGLLSLRGPPTWHPAPDEVKERCRQAAEHCQTKGSNIIKLAVQYSLSEPRVATTLVGTASPENIVTNVAWAAESIDQQLLNEVLGILRPVHNVTWQQGRPENN
jgi:L-galactose dehydrogenase